jgi:hypothetical protein
MRGFVYKYRAIGFALLLVAGIAASTAARADEDVPPMVRDEIEGLLKKKAADLLNQKDSDGVPMKRGTYSRSLKRVDDQTYHVTFHVDTVETGQVKNDQLKTERFLLTVQKNAQGKWAIAKEELKDTYVGLHRTTLGNEFYSFDKLSFEREGLKATASNGYLYKAFFKGEPVGFRLAADDLAYQYAPPSDAGFNYYELIRQRLMRDHPQDLVFKPEYLDVDCDPASCEQLFGGAFTGLKQAGGASSGSAAIRKVYDDQAREFDKSARTPSATSARRSSRTASTGPSASDGAATRSTGSGWSTTAMSPGRSRSTPPAFSRSCSRTTRRTSGRVRSLRTSSRVATTRIRATMR